MPLTITPEHLAAIAGRPTPLMPALAEWMNRLCAGYEIDSAQEYAHFLAQACHETDHFRTLREYASGAAYEGRADLGNSQPGDGVRYRGRGIFQTTGRANYQQLGVKKGQRDLFLNNPELLEQPELAVWSACEYWRTRGLNDIANQPDGAVLKKKLRGVVHDVSPVVFISMTVNGGTKGLAERQKYYAIASRVLAEAEAESAPTPRGTARGMARGMPPGQAPTPRRSPAAGKKAAPAKKAAVAAKERAKPAPAKAAAPKRVPSNKAPAAPAKNAPAKPAAPAKKAAPRPRAAR